MTDTPRDTVWSRRHRLSMKAHALIDRAVNRAAVVVAAAAVLLAYNYGHALSTFKSTIYERCLQRQTYDQSQHDSTVADEQFYAQVGQLFSEALAMKPRQTPAEQEITRKYQAALELARQRKQAAADRGVIGSCQIYR